MSRTSCSRLAVFVVTGLLSQACAPGTSAAPAAPPPTSVDVVDVRPERVALSEEWVATLDGDGQNDPADIPKLLEARASADRAIKLFAGWRVNRRDSGSKRWASKWANAIRSRMLRDSTPDTGCGIKLFEREAFLDLPYFDHMHRYLPALMQRAGWKTVSVPVNHRSRSAGVSKYNNLQRALVGLRDLRGVAWLIVRSKRQHRLTRRRITRKSSLEQPALICSIGKRLRDPEKSSETVHAAVVAHVELPAACIGKTPYLTAQCRSCLA